MNTFAIQDFRPYDLRHGITRLVHRYNPVTYAVKSRTTVSYLIATINRPSLQKTIKSIELREGDEILINWREVPPGTWGHTERNELMTYASAAWLSFIDDDDWYVPGHRAIQQDAMETQPGGRDVPTIFRMRFQNGFTPWDDRLRDPNRPERPELKCGNIGTPMLMMPNLPVLLGQFGMRYVGDFDFINGGKWPRRMYYWRPEVIVEVGNDPRGPQETYADHHALTQ